MAACTFFGHRDCPSTIKEKLRAVIVDLVVNHEVEVFYVGNQGQFDSIVYTVLKEPEHKYSSIRYSVVLAYMPGKESDYNIPNNSILPEGIEFAPPRYAISRRNEWMLKHSEYVITYVTQNFGGAYKYAAKALRQGKIVKNLAEQI